MHRLAHSEQPARSQSLLHSAEVRLDRQVRLHRLDRAQLLRAGLHSVRSRTPANRLSASPPSGRLLRLSLRSARLQLRDRALPRPLLDRQPQHHNLVPQLLASHHHSASQQHLIPLSVSQPSAPLQLLNRSLPLARQVPLAASQHLAQQPSEPASPLQLRHNRPLSTHQLLGPAQVQRKVHLDLCRPQSPHSGRQPSAQPPVVLLHSIGLQLRLDPLRLSPAIILTALPKRRISLPKIWLPTRPTLSIF